MNAADPAKRLGIGGGGVLGNDGKIYAVTRIKERLYGVAVLDPAALDRSKARLLRISPARR